MWTPGDVSTLSELVNLTYLNLKLCQNVQGEFGRFQTPAALLFDTAEALSPMYLYKWNIRKLGKSPMRGLLSSMWTTGDVSSFAGLVNLKKLDLYDCTNLQGTCGRYQIPTLESYMAATHQHFA